MAEGKKICRSCRKSVDAKAKKCPYCQEDLRSWVGRHPILTIILALFLFPILLGSVAPSKTSDSGNSPAQPTKSPAEIQVEEEQRKIEAEQAQINQQEALDAYMELLEASGMNQYIQTVGIQGADMTITVRNTWHYQPKQIRLQTAQLLWEAWVGLCPEDEADLCRITLEDFVGNKVGGSSWLAGSIIEVDD